MKKKYIVKDSKDFEKIIKTGQCEKNKSFIIHYKTNNLEYNRYGISVSKKLGNAVFRNKNKRRIRSIVDDYKKDYINNEDYIIILRKSGTEKKYNELKNDFFELMNRLRKNSRKEINNEKK